jgi:NAD(P)-dependent dehydrogenase (short-subunit alcohol dehydrogenase family)
MAQVELGGRTALVTGASRGIGRAIAERLAQAGARVVASARSTAALEELVASLPGEGHRALPMDVGDADSVARGLEDLGPVELLIPNAGVAASAPYHRTDDAMWDEALRVNATGVFRLCRALVPAMVKARRGRVVIIASNAGLSGYAYTSAYCASKHAVIGMMRAIALEIAESGVTINAVCPGWVDTDMADQAVARIVKKTGKSAAEARQTLEAMSPQRRMVQPEEVAALVAYLCSDDAQGVHGQALLIDGGQVMK